MIQILRLISRYYTFEYFNLKIIQSEYPVLWLQIYTDPNLS